MFKVENHCLKWCFFTSKAQASKGADEKKAVFIAVGSVFMTKTQAELRKDEVSERLLEFN